MLGSCYFFISDLARRLRHDKSGVTAIEYGLIAGAISVAIIATVILIGTDLNNLFTTIEGDLAKAAAPAAN
ncbi:MAG TPA: Flp family type IVb pilin [Alphaproteobacteria bacterium]|nr:Flp family type IVb pilin [Alphaproteobacteria bacterium]HTY69299.1 Flp family type IVb pilin [Alphaproteobacteria bacterium]